MIQRDLASEALPPGGEFLRAQKIIVAPAEQNGLCRIVDIGRERRGGSTNRRKGLRCAVPPRYRSTA
jgi:hypothetical protein